MRLDDETRKNVKISRSYAKSPDAFKYLRRDPSTLEPSEIPHSLAITGVQEDLRRLTTIFTVQRDVEGISHDIDRSLRIVWPTLVPWLDFLHPKHHNARPSSIPLPDLSTVFRSIYALESDAAQKMRAGSQHLCDLLFDFWLHFDSYADDSTDVVFCLHMLGDAVREAMFVAGLKKSVSKVGKQENLHQLCPAHISPVCASAALSTVKYNPRRLYRKALVQVRFALDEAPKSVPQAAALQILAIIELAMEVLPLLQPAQDIICDLVSLMRTVASRDDGAHWTPGVGLILAALWQSARDEKPIVWALQAGLLPLALGLPDGSEKENVFNGILRNAYHVGVLRALSSDGRIPAISPSRLGKNPYTSADAWLHNRVKLMNDAYREICDNVKCTSRTLHGSVPIRHCPCYNASYCSEDCQRAHWALHKKECGKGAEGSSHLGFSKGYLKPRDAHFVAIWTRWYTLAHSPTICHSLRGVRSRLPLSRVSRIYLVTVYLNNLPTQYTVDYNTNAPSYPEDTVVVAACMHGPGRSGTIDLKVKEDITSGNGGPS